MKKSIGLLIVVLTGLIAYSCTLPTAVEIKANPKMSVPAKTDIGKILSDAIKDGFSGDSDIKIYDCENVLPTRTFLIYLPLFEESLDSYITTAHTGGSLSFDAQLTSDILLDEGNFPKDGSDPIDLSVMDDYLSDFRFKGLKAKLYISGTSIVEKLKIELSTANESSNIEGPFSTNGLDFQSTTYAEEDLPNGGGDFTFVLEDILNNRHNLQLSYKVIAKAGETISMPNDTINQHIKAELLIWLPLDFEAGLNGAAIKFPNIAEKDEDGNSKDLFGRKANADSMFDMLRSINLEIKMNNNAFAGGTIYMKQGTFDSEYLLSSDSLAFNLSKQDMDFINNPVNIPFTPEIGIRYEPGEGPSIPRELMVTSLSFEAEIDYRIDL